MAGANIDNDDITLIRGETLSIDVYLTFDSGEPCLHSQIPLDKIRAQAWFQNGERITFDVTELEEESCWNLYSDIDTSKIKGDSFLVNVGIKPLSEDEPIAVATMNQTFYLINSATLPNAIPPEPTGGEHSVVYLVDDNYFYCQNYKTGTSITPVMAPSKSGYEFVSWLNLPSTMPDRCVVAKALYEEVIPEYSEGLLFEDLDSDTCKLIGRGTCTDSYIRIPPTNDGKAVVELGTECFQYDQIIENLWIPDSVELINTSAFRGCSYLSNVRFPDNSICRLNSSCFSNCNLTNITLSSNLTLIEPVYDMYINNQATNVFHKNPFSSITIKEGFAIPSHLPEMGSAVYRHPTWVGEQMFYDCDNIEEITLPNTFNEIPHRMLSRCEKIKTINVLGNLNYLGREIVSQSGSLTNDTVTFNFYGNAPLEYNDNAFYTSSGGFIKKIKINYNPNKNGWTAFKQYPWIIATDQTLEFNAIIGE